MPKKYRNKKIISNPTSPANSTTQTGSASPAPAKGLAYKLTPIKTGAELMAADQKYAKRDIFFSLAVGVVVFALMIVLYVIFR